MDWKPIDFQGIISLDTPLVDLLNQYLDEKEHQLAEETIAVIPPPSVETFSANDSLTLTSAIELFEKADFSSSQCPLPSLVEWKQAINKINRSLWKYVETLEGITSELFQQLDLITIDQWHERLAQVLSSLKEILIHRMEDLIWAIRRLENQLWRMRWACRGTDFEFYYFKLLNWRHPLLDKSLIPTIGKNQEYLRNQFQKFMKRYQGYLELQNEIEPQVAKLHNHRALAMLDRLPRKQFTQLYTLLKAWELNRSTKELPAKEFDLALYNTLSVEKGTTLLKEYHQTLRTALFEASRYIKDHGTEIINDPNERERLAERVLGYQAETHLLGATVNHYRDFLLRADPNLYVRTRLGFSEEPVGSEPTYTKPLLHLGYDLESLSESYNNLIQAIRKGIPQSPVQLEGIEQIISNHLHEMNQPLATHRSLRSNSEQILDQLQQLNELGSLNANIIPITEQILAKLLRADWRYHVSFGIPLFHQLYQTHLGLIEPIDDRQHSARLAKFTLLLHRINEWVKSQRLREHAHEIDLDMNDIKGYLQDFLATIQRTFNEVTEPEKRKLLRSEMAHELLEYRYLFGNFFYQLRQNEEQGPLLRRQFLFVDQYFETIDQKLHDLQT